MSDQINMQAIDPVPTVALVDQLSAPDLNDLCDATDAAIESGGGFGWVELPARDILERYWQGVIAMPARMLFVARLDGVVCGTCQIVKPTSNNEAQGHAVKLTMNFVAPWARGHGLATMLVDKAEKIVKEEGFSVVNLDMRETMDSAIKLYESLGYERIGTHPNYAQVKGETIRGFYYYKELTS